MYICTYVGWRMIIHDDDAIIHSLCKSTIPNTYIILYRHYFLMTGHRGMPFWLGHLCMQQP
jgi:hypothetical protein